MDDAQLERAMADIDKAKNRSREQRIRSFCNASYLGNMDTLARLLNSGVDPNGTDANGRYAIGSSIGIREEGKERARKTYIWWDSESFWVLFKW